jgi:hypothetical protein
VQKRTVWIVSGIVGFIVLGGMAWYLGSPLILNRTVEEQLPFGIPSEEEMEAMSEEELVSITAEVMGTAAAMPDKPMEDSMPSDQELVSLKSGVFEGADRFHQGEGIATIFELPDSSRLLRLADFMVTNGPDLHVLLATGSNPTESEDLGEYVDLGSLKGNLGNQNYQIPSEIDVAKYNSVVIYCVPFHVVFAHADL